MAPFPFPARPPPPPPCFPLGSSPRASPPSASLCVSGPSRIRRSWLSQEGLPEEGAAGTKVGDFTERQEYVVCTFLGGVCWSRTCDKGNGGLSMGGLNVGQGKAFIPLRVPLDVNRSSKSGQCVTHGTGVLRNPGHRFLGSEGWGWGRVRVLSRLPQ